MTRTFLLLAAMTALFMTAGYLIGGQGGMVTALLFAVAMNFGAYWFSDSIVLKMQGARPIGPGEAGGLQATVAQLARRADLPMPKLYLIDTPQPNAFATGRSPKHGALAVTSGLLNLLEPREVEGVLAHELAHIKNRDTLTMTITATLAGAIGMLANFAMFFGGGHRDGEGRPSNPVAGLAVALLAPFAAMLVQMAISRTREYGADRSGAEIHGDPLALAGALEKIERYARSIPNARAEGNPATAHLFIINPLAGHAVDHLFSTHPNTQNRVRALREMATHRGGETSRQAPAKHLRRGTFDFR